MTHHMIDLRDNKFWIMEPQTSLAGKLGRPMILSELVPTELGLNFTLQVSLVMSPIIGGGGGTYCFQWGSRWPWLLSALYLLNEQMDFGQTYTNLSLGGGKMLIRF